jgi:hypothetical protein
LDRQFDLMHYGTIRERLLPTISAFCSCLDSLGVRFRPDEHGVHQPNFPQVLDPLQAKGHQLSRLQRTGDPLVGRIQVPKIHTATEEHVFLNLILKL